MANQNSSTHAITCLGCGNTFFVLESRPCEYGRKYCGHSCVHKTHGKTRSPEFRTWMGMKSRCLYPSFQNFHLYGGRGITVCDRWMHSFANFLADMGKKPTPLHSIDRIDPNGNYELGNCKWSTQIEQANNKRNSRPLTFKGVTKNLTSWAGELGLSMSTFAGRIERGWPEDRIFDPSKRQGEGRRTVSDFQVSIAKEMLFRGATVAKITEVTSVGRGAICRIKTGDTHKSIHRIGSEAGKKLFEERYGVNLDEEARAMFLRYTEGKLTK